MAGPPSDLITPPSDLGPPPDLISPPSDLVEVPDRKPGGFFRGVKEGFVEGLTGAPESFGSGVEAYGRVIGSDTVRRAGESIAEATATPESERAPMVPLRDFFSAPGTFIGQQLGQGVGSTLPTLVSGGAGALVGSAVAPGPGTVIGGLLGAAAPALPMNTGDLYQQLVSEGVDKDRAASLAVAFGPVLTAPDVFSASRMLKPFVGATEFGAKGLARLLVQRIKEGAAVEGLTEMGQQGLQETIAGLETGKANLADRAERVATAGISGGLGGGTVGGAGAVIENRRGSRPAGGPPDDLIDVQTAGDTPEVGTVFGLKSGDTVERGVVEAVDGDTVVWRDAAGNVRAETIGEWNRDRVDAPPPADEIKGDATTVGEPPMDLVEESLTPQPDVEVEARRRPGDEVQSVRLYERAQVLIKRAQREQAKLDRGADDALPQSSIDAILRQSREFMDQADAGSGRSEDPGPQPRGDEAGIVPRQGSLALESVERAAAETNTAPTEAQKESGNYKKGRVTVQGINIAIENPRGSERTGTGPEGPWSVTMPAHYGYVERTEGKDGDQVDVYVGDNPDADTVYVVDQVDPKTGKFDEHKAFLGFPSQDAAEMTYAEAFSDGSGPRRMGGIAAMSVADFRTWVKSKGTKKAASSPSVSSAPETVPVEGKLTGREEAKPRKFWRATKADSSGERIRTGDNFWDSLLFASDNKDSASMYGGQNPLFEQIDAKPDAKILYEGSKEFRGLAKGLVGKNMLEFASTVAQRARDAGYDAVWFKRQSDVGTAIINENAFVRNSDTDNGPKLTSGLDPTDAYRLLKETISSVTSRLSTPMAAAQSTRIPVGSPDSLSRLSSLGRYLSFATGLASRDRASGTYFSALLDRDRARETLERSAHPVLEPYAALKDKTNVNRALEHDRIAGFDRKDTGRQVVIRVAPNLRLDLSKPGDTIRLSPEETKAFFSVRKFTDQRLMELGAAMAREQGYEGEFTAKAIAAASGRSAERAAQILEAVTEARRRGYVPLNRYGDYYIKILPKQVDVPGKDATPPSLRDGRFEFIDSRKAWSSVLSERSGSSPKIVTDRVRELEKQYPRDRFTYDIGRVTPKTVETLNIPLIEKLFAAVNFHDAALGQQLYDNVLSQVYKDRMAGFRKASENIAGYSTDFERSIADYVRQTSSVIANMDHGKTVEDAYKGVESHADPHVREFWQSHRRYIENRKSDFGSLRKFGFFNFLWGSPSSAIINLTQTPLVTGFQLGSWAGVGRGQQFANGAIFEALGAIKPSGTRGFTLDIEKIGKTAAEKQMLRTLMSEGLLDANIASDLQGADLSKDPKYRGAARALNRVYEIGASMFNTAEQANRVAAALAYFRAAQSGDLRKKMAAVYADDQLFREQVGRSLDPTDIARFGVDETQFIGGKMNRQPITRGAGALAFQFQQYNANYMRLLYKNFTRMGHEGKVAGTMMLLALVGAGGLLGAPFADDIVGGAQALYKAATGIDPLLERRLAAFLADDLGFGAHGAEIIMRGPSRSLLGIDLSKRIGMGDIAPKNDVLDVAGPVASATIGRLMEVGTRYSTGQPIAAAVTAVQPIIGKGPSDVLRGTVQLPNEGYSTQRGDIKIMPSDITGDEMAARALGFQPTRFARRMESDYEDKRLAENTKEASAKLLTKIAREMALAEDARKAGDQEAVRAHTETAESIIRENAELFAAEGADWSKVPPPTAKAIRGRMTRYLEPEAARIKNAPKTKRDEMQKGPFLRE